MTKDDLISEWSEAIDSGKFLMSKHEPASLPTSHRDFRTVLTPQAATNLSRYIKSGHYGIRHFDDAKFPRGSGFFEIVPSGTAPFDVAGSGIPGRSMTTSAKMDRLVVVCGQNVGSWKLDSIEA